MILTLKFEREPQRDLRRRRTDMEVMEQPINPNNPNNPNNKGSASRKVRFFLSLFPFLLLLDSIVYSETLYNFVLPLPFYQMRGLNFLQELKRGGCRAGMSIYQMPQRVKIIIKNLLSYLTFFVVVPILTIFYVARNARKPFILSAAHLHSVQTSSRDIHGIAMNARSALSASPMSMKTA